jgi:hypothetical protein
MEHKRFRTYTEQRELLESRGLIIPHPRFFTNCMQQDDYYNVINGYKKHFIRGMNPEHYAKGTTFEQVYALYSFDQVMRSYFLTELIKIEKHIKSLIAYHFSEIHGYDHRQYLDPNCFKNDSPENRRFASRTITNLENAIRYYTQKGTNSICHYIKAYGYVPLWVLNSVTSFGQVAHFYSCMKVNEQSSIAKHFKLSANQLDGFIYFLSDIRNTCAHGSRIYMPNKKYKFQRLIPDTKIHAELEIPQNNAQNYIRGKTDVLAILITLKVFSKKSDFRMLKKHLKKHYARMEAQIPKEILHDINQEMGFPMTYLSKL